MRDIKPIETYYNGYRFRSRLEARWAVFFDAAGIEYEYEPEAFSIPQTYGNHNGAYLPDFYLPRFDVYAEVKGSDQQLEADSGKIGDAIDYMSTPMSEKGLIILGQIPYRDVFHDGLGDKIPAFHMLSWHKGVVSGYCSFVYFWKQRAPHEFVYSPTDFRSGDPEIFGFDSHCGCPIPKEVSTKCDWIDICWKVDALRTMHPYEIARQARFEHGETPHIRCEYISKSTI